MRTRSLTLPTTSAGLALLLMLAPHAILAHCDTLDGPTVADARQALASKDVTPALKWVAPDDEAQVRAAFTQALKVRELGPEARELADAHFFDTLLRLHRASEGMPFTGVKPSGTPLEPGIAMADESIASGDGKAVAKAVGDHVASELAGRFARVMEAKAHAAHTVEAGRRYVAAYVAYVHYVEGLMAPAEHGHVTTSPEGAHSH